MKTGDMRSARPKSVSGKSLMKKQPAPLKLVLPATSANLGPAFDSAALALKLHLEIQAHVAPEFSIAATGRDREICGKLERNLVLETYKEMVHAEGKTPLALTSRVCTVWSVPCAVRRMIGSPGARRSMLRNGAPWLTRWAAITALPH